MKTAPAFVLMTLLIFSLAHGEVAKAPDGIEFVYYDPAAVSVSLAGNFNNWDTNASPMTKDAEGFWRVVVPLSPGTYEYKFVINGSQWMADPDNPKVVGDYGNSEITINEKGEPVVTGAVTVVSNTPANARVMITGWFRGTYGLRKNVLGDPRYRGIRPSHEMYVSVNPTIGSDVKGSATLRLDSGVGDIREVTADLYAAWLAYKTDRFGVTGYHNQEILSFDDPLKAIGHIDLAGTLEDDDVDYGRGTQGVVGDFKLMGIKARAFYSNTYDQDIYDSPTRFLFRADEAKYDTLPRYDNVGTDVMGLRIKRAWLGVDWGATLVSHRNGWWVGFDEQQESPALQQYTKVDTLSDWFEMGTEEWFVGADLAFKPAQWISAFGEYAWTSYHAGWDAGNRVRKQGDVLVDGKIDVPVGDEDGRRLRIGLDLDGEKHSLGLWYERYRQGGMGAGEVYVTSQRLPFEDPDTPLMMLYGPSLVDYRTYQQVYVNVFNIEDFVIYELQGLPERESDGAGLDFSASLWGLDLGLEMNVAKQEWRYDGGPLKDADLTWLKVLPSVSGSLFKERLTYTFIYADTEDNLHPRMPSPFDRNEFHAKGDLALVQDWSLYYNLRWAGYQWTEDDADHHDSFFDPHLALVWSPMEKLQIRLGYGLNPLYYRDTPVEGREIGRERWVASRLWLDPLTTLVEAERDLEDQRIVFLMGVIAF